MNFGKWFLTQKSLGKSYKVDVSVFIVDNLLLLWFVHSLVEFTTENIGDLSVAPSNRLVYARKMQTFALKLLMGNILS